MQRDNHNNVLRLANWLLSKAVRNELHEEFLGDLKEAHEDRITSRGKAYAAMMYWVDVIYLLLGFSSFRLFSRQNSTIMTGHYLHTFRRNFARNTAYSFMNILSLVVGMGVCLAICQYIYFELSAYRIELNGEWSTVLLTTFLIFVVMFLTIGFHVLRAARCNPVRALRSE